MVHAKLSRLKDRTVATAGATAVMLSLPLAAPLVSAVANSQSQLAPLSYEHQIAVVDPVTGLLIHPITGVVIDLADVIYDPVIGQYVDHVTGAIIPTDGSIPGLPLLPPGDPQSGVTETSDSVNRATDQAVGLPVPPSSPVAPAVPARPQRQSRSSGSQQPAGTVPDGEPLGAPAQSGLALPPPMTVEAADSSTFALPSPAAVIANVVDSVLGSSDSSGSDETAPAPPLLPSDLRTSASSHQGATVPNGSHDLAWSAAEADAAELASSAAPAPALGQRADIPLPPGPLTLDGAIDTHAAPGSTPQIFSPAQLPTPQRTDGSVEFAPPPMATRDFSPHIIDRAPSWLLAIVGSFLIMGGAGISYRLRRRSSPTQGHC